MLKYSVFSEHYLASRSERNIAERNNHNVSGNLALSEHKNAEKRMPISRGCSRTWWESGWQNRR